VSLLLALVLASAQPSEAEIGSPASVEDRRALHLAGQCIVNERSREARALLAMDFREKKYGRAMHNLINSRAPCRNVEVPRGVYRANGLLWAGTLADWLLRRDRVLDDLAGRTKFKPDLPAIEARNAGEYLAFCSVRTNPAGTGAVLRAEPATAEEYAALKALGPTLGFCVPKNSKAEFTRDSLRALLALGAWRLAMHNAQPPLATREQG
jgi:hypothetical protein